MQAFVAAVTVLMITADGMPEEPHVDLIWPNSASSTQLDVTFNEITALKTVQTQKEKLMADKDTEIAANKAEIAANKAEIAEKDTEIAANRAENAALKEQIKRQGPLLPALSPLSLGLSPSRKLLVDKVPIKSTPPSPKAQMDSRSSCSQVVIRSSSDGPLPWAECPIGVLGEAMASDKCTESNYGFIHADSDKFTKGAWSRSILDNPRIYIYTHTEKPCVPLHS